VVERELFEQDFALCFERAVERLGERCQQHVAIRR
jgi:hypothetical protein